jgi:hypothetical protein
MAAEPEKILPCGRCAGAAGLEAFELNGFVRWRVRCGRCQAMGIHYHRAPVAIGLWNEAAAAAAWADAAGQVAEASGQITTLRPAPAPAPADAGGLEAQLIAILAKHCGERGDNEGAVETLCRIIRERDEANEYIRAENETEADDLAEPPPPTTWPSENATRTLPDP